MREFLSEHLAGLDVLVPGPVLYIKVGNDLPPSSTDPRIFEPRSG